MQVPTFEFEAGEWEHNEELDFSGYSAIVKFDGVEVWRSDHADLYWNEAAAVDAARDHTIRRLRSLFDDGVAR